MTSFQRKIYWYYIIVIDICVGNQLLITVYTKLIMSFNWLVNDDFRWLDLQNHPFKSITELCRLFLNFRKTEKKNLEAIFYMSCVARFGACNFTKINSPPWVFFTFLKLYKWYQTYRIVSRIAQCITYICTEWNVFW